MEHYTDVGYVTVQGSEKALNACNTIISDVMVICAYQLYNYFTIRPTALRL